MTSTAPGNLGCGAPLSKTNTPTKTKTKPKNKNKNKKQKQQHEKTKMASMWLQDGFKMAQDGLKLRQDGFRWGHDGVKMASREPPSPTLVWFGHISSVVSVKGVPFGSQGHLG